MDRRKRCFDLAVIAAVALPLASVAIVLALMLLVAQGRPVFYASDRMAGPGRAFRLWKFRTMTHGGAAGVTGGHVAAQVTPVGRVLRRLRLDELPQVWNVLRGDMGLVGPRPPLPQVVAAHPQLYADVLRVRPGLTGLATLVYHRREAELLAPCRTAASTEAVYMRHCVPAKARLDRLYLRRRGLGLDAAILALTLADRLLPGMDARSVLRRGRRAARRARSALQRRREKLWTTNTFRTFRRLRLTKTQGLRPTIPS